jgi:hypothetical protein
MGAEGCCSCRLHCSRFAQVIQVVPRDTANHQPVLAFHTKYSYWLSNGIGMVKLATLLFVSITGLVVLGGRTRVPNPGMNFSQPFKGNITPYGATTALYRIIFSYAGYENAFNVTNEIKVHVSYVGSSLMVVH